MSLRQTAPFPSGPAEIVKRPVEELSKEVSNIILNSPSPATQMARLDTKLDTILDKVNDSTKDLREELKATRDELKATREEFKAEHEALSKKVDDLSQSRAADDDKAVLDAIGKDGAAYLLKHDGLDFDEDFKMTRTVERMIREALEKHNKIIGADEARDLVLKWVDRVNSEPKKPAKRPRREGPFKTACNITIDASEMREHNKGCATCRDHVRSINDKKRQAKQQPRNGD